MYFPSDQACSVVPNSQVSDPKALAATNRLVATINAEVAGANAAWADVTNRAWQSFAQFGPNVVAQFRDTPDAVAVVSNGTAGPGINSPAVLPDGTVVPALNLGPNAVGATPIPVPVSVVSQGNPNGGNPSAGGAGGRRRRIRGAFWSRGPVGLVLVSDGSVPQNGPAGAVIPVPGGSGPGPESLPEFVNTFPPDYQTYTGPTPKPGSVMSLTYGGNGSPSAVGPAAHSAVTPWPWVTGVDCSAAPAVGVASLPWGESASINASGTAAAAGSSSGIVGDSGAWLLGLLVLAGVAYAADHYDKRKGRY